MARRLYPPSILKITLKKVDGGTKLTLDQTRVPSSQVKYYENGWNEYYWKPLLNYLKRAK
jgi:hypothetical protein